MKNQACRASKLALLAAFGAIGPSFADVTPEEVWQNWQDASAALGQTMIAGSVARDGDTLNINDITIASAVENVTVEGSLDLISMKDQGDGTVLITMSPEFPMKMRLSSMAAGRPEIESNILFSHTDLTLTASGTVDDLVHDMQAPSMGFRMERITSPAGDSENFTLEATLSNLAGSYRTSAAGEAMSMDSDFKVDGVALAMVGTNPDDASELRLTANMNGLTADSTGALLMAMSGAEMAPEMLAAMNSTSNFAIADQQFDLEVVGEEGTTSISGTTGAGSVSAAVANGVMDYAASQENLALIVNAPGIPLPDLAIAMETTSFGLTMPLVPSDVALPFAFSTSLQNLILSDQLWALFDPSGKLPRDPINLVIDTEGMAKPNAIASGAGASPALPAELESLNLKELRLNAAGAELAGSGSSTFDPVEGGMPSPNAKLDFTLTGANGLMDRLVQAGLLSPEMLTMPRMMLAMIARPAPDGSDSYQSAIEIRDKAIFANGQKLHQME